MSAVEAPAKVGDGRVSIKAPAGGASEAPAAFRSRRLAPSQGLLATSPWVLVACLFLSGCSEEESLPFDDIEGLAFLSAGRGSAGDKLEWSIAAPLLVDRFEVTRGQWMSWVEGRASENDSSEAWRFLGPGPPADFIDETRLPATSMNLGLAREFADWHHMRLPTASEWMFIASGKRSNFYPWGTTQQLSSVNTLELGLGRAVPVGSFGNGRSPLDVHDLIGNVWEWVEEPLDGGLPLAAGVEGPWPFADDSWVMGGSYLWQLEPLYSREVLFAKGVAPEFRSSDVGFRRVADARSYLLVRAVELSQEGLRRRLIALGSRWGSNAIALLEDLSSNQKSAPALSWLLEGAQQ